MNVSKTFFALFTKTKSDKGSKNAVFIKSSQISREELREFLINNRLQGELLMKVNELKACYSDLTNYRAIEILLDQQENNKK